MLTLTVNLYVYLLLLLSCTVNLSTVIMILKLLIIRFCQLKKILRDTDLIRFIFSTSQLTRPPHVSPPDTASGTPFSGCTSRTLDIDTPCPPCLDSSLCFFSLTSWSLVLLIFKYAFSAQLTLHSLNNTSEKQDNCSSHHIKRYYNYIIPTIFSVINVNCL